MTFHQPNWSVSGDVYNVGHDLILTKDSTVKDVTSALSELRSDVEKADDLSPADKASALADIDQAREELSSPAPSKTKILDRLGSVTSILAGASGAAAAAATLVSNLSTLTDWVTKFF